MNLSYNDTIAKICSDLFDIYRAVKKEHNLVGGELPFERWAFMSLQTMIAKEQDALNKGEQGNMQFIPIAIHQMLSLKDVNPQRLLTDFDNELATGKYK